MRYAIYFVPALESALWRFGCESIGYDAATGRDVPLPNVDGISPADVEAATSEPRRYGFHATMKPPFELAAGQDADVLHEAAAAFAAAHQPFTIPGLRVAALGRFLALIPAERSAELQALAGDCVEAFEPFRAPLSDADRARRLAKPLTPRQQEYVNTWGYPYVFEEFRFHMTLTGPLDEHLREAFLPDLTRRYAPIDTAVPIDGIALCHQPDRQSRFRLVEHFTFGA